MSTLLEAPPAPVLPAPTVEPAPARTHAAPPPPTPRLDPADHDLAGNPVAAIHARPRRQARTQTADPSRLHTILVWGVVIPTILFLVSNPLGWVLLFFSILAVGALTGIGSIL